MRGNPSDRAAVARVLDAAQVTCPAGVVPSSGRGTLVEAGDGCAVVKIEKIYNPSFSSLTINELVRGMMVWL